MFDNKNLVKKETVIAAYELENFTVKILYFEFSGGGTAFEYEVLENDTSIQMSRDGHGNPASAAATAFQYVSDLM